MKQINLIRFQNIILIIGLLASPKLSFSLELTEVALFNRCFSHITRKAPALNNSLLLDVIAGRKTGSQACIETLNKAKLVRNNSINNVNDSIAKDILNTFYAVHSGWFLDQSVVGASFTNLGLMDSSSGSLYYTKALFDPAYKYEDIFTNQNSYEAIRSGGSPEVNGVNRTKQSYIIGRLDLNQTETRRQGIDVYFTTGYEWSGVLFPQTGDLIGIKNETPMVAPGHSGVPTGLNIKVNGSWGGGILGHRDYLMKTINSTSVNSDGGVHMPRRFGRAIFNDFVCRDLPVVDIMKDTTPYVDANSSITFRTNKGCVSCHVSMDQVSAITRHYTMVNLGINRNGGSTGRAQFERTPSITAPYSWPSTPDPDYFRKTYLGKFVYRTTDDNLISRDINSFNALGNIFKSLDDTYLCTASRYFKHFTNINYPITKIPSGVRNNDPHALFIKKLANDLKTSQSSFKTLESIISSDIYRDSNFLIQEK